MEHVLRPFLVMQFALLIGIYFERIKCHAGFSSFPMRLLRLGAFVCMLLILFIDVEFLSAILLEVPHFLTGRNHFTPVNKG